MALEKIHKDGLLFNMIDNHLKEKHIKQLSARSDDTGDEWILIYTDLGTTYLIEKPELRRIRLNYLINKIKNKKPMNADIPRDDTLNELETKACNGDKEAQKLLDKIDNGESFYIGNRKYRIVSK